MADGEMGMRIVEESAKKGSKDYEIVLKLVERGAKIIKTEDVSLLKKEFKYIVGMTKEKSSIKRFIAALKYRLKKKKLLQERDRFIAKTIDETLNDGEVGILFLGAYHNILDKLPEDILIIADVFDIWMRDFTTVNPQKPVQFRYTWASMNKQDSIAVQNSFASFADHYGIQRNKADLLIDGGNIVDNYAGRIITTTRFMEDNRLTYEQAKEELSALLGAAEVAILEPDEDVLGHSDGMVSWIDEDRLLVNDYSSDPAFRTLIMDELQSAFPTATIIEVPVEYAVNPPGQWDGFESACGVNLNAAVTYKNIYVPVFNMAHDQSAVDLIKQNTTKSVITVNAENVCPMGGSVRCLTWQLSGSNAERLILAARDE